MLTTKQRRDAMRKYAKEAGVACSAQELLALLDDIDVLEGKSCKPQPTPTPWRKGRPGTVVADAPIDGGVGGTNDAHSVEHYGGYLICETVTEANAERIVESVNAYNDNHPWVLISRCIATFREVIPYAEHPADCQIENWLWQIRHLAQDRKFAYEHKQQAEERAGELARAAKAVIEFYGAHGGPLADLRRLVGIEEL